MSEASPNKTIYAVWIADTNYSVAYDANGGTGTVPTTQTESNNNATQTFTVAGQGGLTRTGYTFQGWADSKAKADAGTVDYAAGAMITLTKADPAKTLYAVWKSNAFGNITTMQQLTSAICKSAAIEDTARLTDTRDGKVYWVTKLSDRNCWTTQNMDYEISGKSTAMGTTRSSDGGYFWENGLAVMNKPDAATTTIVDDTWSASTDVDFYTKNGNSAIDTANKIYDAHYLTGNYYQYSAIASVCPSGWDRPSSNQAVTMNGSYNKLVNGQSVSSDAWIMAKPYFFPRTGRVDASDGPLLRAILLIVMSWTFEAAVFLRLGGLIVLVLV